MNAVTASADQRHGAVRRALARRASRQRRWTNISIGVGIVLVVALPVLALGRPLLGLPGPNTQDLDAALAAPSVAHPFGTDEFGRDMLSRVLAATWIDYSVAIVTTYVALVIGLAVGAVAGYYKGWIDPVLMRITDALLAFPGLVFLLAIVAVMGPGLKGIYIALIVLGWAPFARITRAEMLKLRETQFIAAARSLGIPTWRIFTVHALPNLIKPNLVYSMANVVANILGLAALSYLGLGVRPPDSEWGALVADGQALLLTNWWVATLPGLVIVVVGAGFSLIADGVADRLGYEPRATV